MAKARESVELTFKADIGDLKKTLAEVPGISAKEAKKMAAALEKGMLRAEKAAQRAARKSKSSWADAAKGLGAAAAAAAAGIARLGQDVADTRNGIAALSTRSGVAAETIAGLKLAAEVSGQPFENLNELLNPLPQRLAMIQKGSLEQVDAFRALGVSATDSNGNLRDADVIFKELVKGIGELKTPTEQAAAATTVFGESGGKLLQALGDPTALQTFVNAASGAAINSQAAAASAAGWQRSMAMLNLQIDNTKALIVDGLGVGNAVENIGQFVAMGNAFVGRFAEFLSARFTAVGNVIQSVFNMDWAGLKAATGEILDTSFAGSEGFVAAIVEGAAAADAAWVAYNKTSREIGEATKAAEAFRTVNLDLGKGARDRAAAAAGPTDEEKAQEKAAAHYLKMIEKKRQADMGFYNFRMEQIAEIQSLEQAGALTAVQATDARAAVSEQLDAEFAELSAEISEAMGALDAMGKQAVQNLINQGTQAASVTASTIGGFSQLLSVMADQNSERDKKRARKQFAMAKVAGVSEAMINGAVAITRALAMGGVLGGLAAAGIAATTAAQVAVISSQQPSFNDTPGVMQAGGRAARVGFAPGDYFAAAQTPQELARQANEANRNAGGSGGEPTVVVLDRPLFKGRTWGEAERAITRRPGPLSKALRDAKGKRGRGRGGF